MIKGKITTGEELEYSNEAYAVVRSLLSEFATCKDSSVNWAVRIIMTHLRTTSTANSYRELCHYLRNISDDEFLCILDEAFERYQYLMQALNTCLMWDVADELLEIRWKIE